MKALIALLGGSAASAFITTAALTIHNLVAYDGQSLDFLSAMRGFAVLAFFANLLVASTTGLFWHTYARVFGLTHVLSYTLPAIALGAVLVLVFLELIGTNEPELGESARAGGLSLLMLGASLGGLTGYFFWLICRPDRDAPNPPTSAS